MSWSIETTFLESPGLKELKSAIDAAEKAKITMFCSASDQGEMSSKFCYPGSWSKCIRIGACTATGERCTWVHGEAIDFLLPGKDILVDGGGGDGAPPSYQSGSSFATALATGLGALLLYCNERVSPRSKEGLRELENMKNAFSRLSSDGKFPRVKNYFDLGSENGSWGDMEWNDETSKKLARIMGDIRVSLPYPNAFYMASRKDSVPNPICHRRVTFVDHDDFYAAFFLRQLWKGVRGILTTLLSEAYYTVAIMHKYLLKGGITACRLNEGRSPDYMDGESLRG